MAEFEKGDRVRWKSHGGTAVGTVERKITEATEAGGRKVSASKEAAASAYSTPISAS